MGWLLDLSSSTNVYVVHGFKMIVHGVVLALHVNPYDGLSPTIKLGLPKYSHNILFEAKL